MIIISFGLCLLAFIIIGLLSTIKSRQTSNDYLLADQSVKPWLVALSAVATTNSGYMFVGMIGYTYQVGISSIWLMVGWIFGDFLASLLVHQKLRLVTEKNNILSFAGVLSSWHNTDYPSLRKIAGLITLVFLGIYAAAQLNAGSKALYVLFDWDYAVGAIIGAIIVMLYCFSGGIRASIWTDAAQSFVMISAMTLLLFLAIHELGGVSPFIKQLDHVSPTFLSLFPTGLPFGHFVGPGLFVLGWVFSGFGVVGQPHIMVRFMTMITPQDIKKVRYYYYGWYTTFFAITILTALTARLLLPNAATFDSELALPILAQQLLPEALVGLILAGLFAATMSTADSQILSCSAAITHDLNLNKNQSLMFTKLATIVVTLIALSIALFGNKSVFSLVLIAWSTLASAFAPLLGVYALGGKPNEQTAIAMLCTGVIATLIWRQLGFHHQINETIPGMLMGLAPYFLARYRARLTQ